MSNRVDEEREHINKLFENYDKMKRRDLVKLRKRAMISASKPSIGGMPEKWAQDQLNAINVRLNELSARRTRIFSFIAIGISVIGVIISLLK